MSPHLVNFYIRTTIRCCSFLYTKIIKYLIPDRSDQHIKILLSFSLGKTLLEFLQLPSILSNFRNI